MMNLRILVCTLFCLAPLAAGAGSLAPVPDAPPFGLRQLDTDLNQANELSCRRRLTTLFPNEQSPFYGVQLNFVNVNKYY